MDSPETVGERDKHSLTKKGGPLSLGQRTFLALHERHPAGGGILREVVFGANDGLISSLALVSGMAGATTSRGAILLAGLAGVVAGTVSMALGAYISTKSVREFRESEEQRERYEIAHLPALERAELAEIYRRKGFVGAELERVLDRLTETPERWLQIMMSEELGFAGEAPNPYVAAAVMGASFVGGGMVPVCPYFVGQGTMALALSAGLTAIGLFGVGWWRGTLVGRGRLRKGVEMVFLGGLSFTLSYLIGWFIGAMI